MLGAVAVPILSFDGSLSPFATYPDDIAVSIAAGSLLLAIAWYSALRIVRPAAVSAAAGHASDDATAAGWPAARVT